jgi:hypothetical protein
LTLLAASIVMTFAQLDPSAQAPWASTTVALFFVVILLLQELRRRQPVT